jgi:hypothetical protein
LIVVRESRSEIHPLLGLAKRRHVDGFLGKIQMAIAGAIVVFGASLKADLAQFVGAPVVQSLLKWMQGTAWLVVVLGPISVAVVQWGRRKFGTPWAWEAIQKLIDEFRNEVFGDQSDDPLDHHRVTLFKYHKSAVGLRHPREWSNWLIAVARSDHLTKLRIRRFRAPDDGEQCEGVVGRAWRCRGWVIVPNPRTVLPILNQESPATDRDSYAKETGVSVEWVNQQLQRGRPLASSYAALVVLLKGQPWGVLVLDSRKPGSIDVEKLKRFSAYGKLLTPLLERV